MAFSRERSGGSRASCLFRGLARRVYEGTVDLSGLGHQEKAGKVVTADTTEGWGWLKGSGRGWGTQRSMLAEGDSLLPGRSGRGKTGSNSRRKAQW